MYNLRLRFFSLISLLFLSLIAHSQSFNNWNSHKLYFQNANGSKFLAVSENSGDKYGERLKYHRFEFIQNDNLIVWYNHIRDEVYDIKSVLHNHKGDAYSWVCAKRSDPNSLPTIITMEETSNGTFFIQALELGDFQLWVWEVY